LLFSDIEGSTALLQRAGDRYRELLGRHDELLRASVAGQGGVVVDTAGDSFFVAFATAAEGAAAAAGSRFACGWVCTPGNRGWWARTTWALMFIVRRG
jgi:class 3 adenylate cyclase